MGVPRIIFPNQLVTFTRLVGTCSDTSVETPGVEENSTRGVTPVGVGEVSCIA